MPPPKISPAPTTKPIEDATSPAGADSAAIGPESSAIRPKLKKDKAKSKINKLEMDAAELANKTIKMVEPRKLNTALKRRPNQSEKAGTRN